MFAQLVPSETEGAVFTSHTLKTATVFLTKHTHTHTHHAEVVYGVQVRLCGDCRKVSGPCLILLNHRTRFDWLFFWSYIIRMGNPSKHRIVLKDTLKKVPGIGEGYSTTVVECAAVCVCCIGWGMQACQFIFITRNWEKDRKILSDNIAYYSSRGYPVELLFFPEGTDLSETNRLKSHKFAEKNGLQKYEYVLHPRTTGFVHCIEKLKEGTLLPNIVDVTVAYVGDIPQNESDILAGHLPKEIHFRAETIPFSELPTGEEELGEWLKQCWQKKETTLKEFYERERFNVSYLAPETGLSRTKLALIRVLVFWAVFLVLSFYLFSVYPWVVLGLSVFYVLVSMVGPGLDWVLLQLHQMTYQAKLFSKN